MEGSNQDQPCSQPSEMLMNRRQLSDLEDRRHGHRRAAINIDTPQHSTLKTYQERDLVAHFKTAWCARAWFQETFVQNCEMVTNTTKGGKISVNEWHAAIDKLGLEWSPLSDLFLNRHGEPRKINIHHVLGAMYPHEEQSRIDWLATNILDVPVDVFVDEIRPLTEDELTFINELFDLYDADGDGTVDIEELMDALRASGWSREDVSTIFCQYDDDSSKALDREEFTKLIGDPMRTQDSERRF